MWHINILFEINSVHFSSSLSLYGEQQGNNYLELVFLSMRIFRSLHLCSSIVKAIRSSGAANEPKRTLHIWSCATINAMLRFNTDLIVNVPAMLTSLQPRRTSPAVSSSLSSYIVRLIPKSHGHCGNEYNEMLIIICLK